MEIGVDFWETQESGPRKERHTIFDKGDQSAQQILLSVSLPVEELN